MSGLSRLLLLASALLLAGSGAPDEARAQASCPDAVDPAATEGWDAYARGDATRARARFEEALSRCPGHVAARTGLGYVHLRQGSPSTARTLFARLVEEDPTHVDARVGLGLLAWRRGDLDEMARQFREVLRLVPDHETAGRYLARAEEAREPAGPPDEAARALEAGEPERAARLYSARVAADSSDTPALQRLALLRARSGRSDEALALMETLAGLVPESADVRVNWARILAWSGRVQEALRRLDFLLADDPGNLRALEAKARFLSWTAQEEAFRPVAETVVRAAPEARPGVRVEPRALLPTGEFDRARTVYDSLAAREPEAVGARVGLALALSYGGRYDSARVVFRDVLRRDPGNVSALVGLGRTLAWSGDLRGAERALRQAREMDPESLDVHVALAQVLRWQGRTAAALEVLQDAEEAFPANPEVETQLRWVRSRLGPRARPSLAWEGDSEENGVTTTSVAASYHPLPRASLAVDVYRRDATRDPLGLDQLAQGFLASGSYQLEPGWSLSVGAGATESDGVPEDAFSSFLVSVSTPGRYRVSGGVTLTRSPLDATALQVLRGVSVDRATADLRWSPAARWSVTGSGSLARYGVPDEEENDQWEVGAGVHRTVGRSWRVGLGLRGFGFEADLADGYFDPDFYGIAEVTGRWSGEWDRWLLGVEAAPGLQQIGTGGDVSPTFRSAARIGYSLAPGREVHVTGALGTNGLWSASTGEDYWHRSVLVGASWVVY